MNRSPWWQTVAATLIILGTWLWFFGQVILSSETFAFRDVAHFYYPLFQWANNEWSLGRVPIWNPQENCGMPILADTTSSLLYPGKLVFAIPSLDFATRFELYIALHVLLAAAGAYWLARRFHASPVGSCASAVSYAFCGNVLFQYCNVVFLVGAAWLPFAVYAAQQMLRRRQLRWSFVLGAILALMTLGGDPQAAYHVGLMAVLLSVLIWIRQRRVDCHSNERPRLLANQSRQSAGRVTLLTCAALTGGVLAAVQILPAVEWSRQSNRSLYENPRNVYESAKTLLSDDFPEYGERLQAVRRGLFSQPAPFTHHDSIYQFSVGPWRAGELIWPGSSGRMFPENRRWIGALRWEGRVWTPSLYMGLLPLLLSVGTIRLRGGTIRRQWISWFVVLAAVGALGEYGLGWIVDLLRNSVLTDQPSSSIYGRPVGGLYWLFVTFLPGYASFRYPAKLLVIAALGLSLLAAIAWDRALQRRSAKLATLLALFAIVSIAGAAALAGTRHLWWAEWLNSARPKLPFGPLNAEGAATDLIGALVHTCLLCTVLSGLFLLRQRFRWIGHSVVATAAVIITAVDVSVAHRWLVPTAPLEIWATKSPIAERISDHDAVAQDIGPVSRNNLYASRRTRVDQRKALRRSEAYRVYRGSSDLWYVPRWREESSRDRIREWVRWDRSTLKPRFNLLTGQSIVGSYGSMVSRDFRILMEAAKDRGMERPDRIREPHPAVLEALSVRYLVMPENAGPLDNGLIPVPLSPTGWTAVRDAERRTTSQPHQPDNVRLWHNPDHLPRAWIVHDVQQLDPVHTSNPQRLKRRSGRILFVGDSVRNLRNSAVVESDALLLPKVIPPKDGDAEKEQCRMVVDESQYVEIEATLVSTGMVVLNDLYYPGWKAQVIDLATGASKDYPIVRANRIMRGVFLSPGRYRIAFRYQPMVFYLGAAISFIGWLLLPLALTLAVRRRTTSAAEK